MAKRAKAAARRTGAKSPKVKPGELLTLLDFIRYGVSRFVEAKLVFAHGTTDPVGEAAFLVCESLHLGPDQFEPFANTRVTAAESAKLLDVIERRVTTRKPAAYLVNKIYMRDLPFYVDERVIVPRSFIGELLESHFSGEDSSLIDDPAAVKSVLDLCTGSGCLAILATYRFPNARIDAVELSADALKVAARNVADHGLGARITLHQGDLFEPLGGARYDLIISNPPYVDAEGMAGLPEECRAVSEVLARVGDKWTVLVVTTLGDGSNRFNELRRALGSISQRMLTLTLRGLERDGPKSVSAMAIALDAQTCRQAEGQRVHAISGGCRERGGLP